MYSLAQSPVFALLASLQLAHADYYIDDTNSTLNYSSGPSVRWEPFYAGGEYTLQLPLFNGTYVDVDPLACYDYT